MTDPNVLKALEGLESAVLSLSCVMEDMVDFRDIDPKRLKGYLREVREALDSMSRTVDREIAVG